MNITSEILLVFLIGLFVQSNNIDLNTNTNFLFLLLLILSLNSQIKECCRDRNCPRAVNNFNDGFNNGFPNFF